MVYAATPKPSEPTFVLVLTNLTNGDIEHLADYIAAQPPAVRARAIERCSSLVGAIAERFTGPNGAHTPI